MNKKFILTLVTSAAAVYISQANAMGIKVYNDSDAPAYALLTAQDCTYPNPQLTIPAGGSAQYQNLEQYHCLAAGRVYVSTTQLPYKPGVGQRLGGPYQLVEYTFSNNGKPTVDYDFSAVDSLYDLPLAVEASDPTTPGQQIGWTGMSPTQNKEFLKTKMQQFTASQGDFPGWPYMNYPGAPTPYQDKVAGGYNLFALTSPSDLDQNVAGKLRPYLVARWYSWYNNTAQCTTPLTKTECDAIHQSAENVINAFVANAKVNGKGTPTQTEVIEHIMGYVPFGASWDPIDSNIAEQQIGLMSGVPSKDDIKNPDYQAILYPSANQPNALNPYVSFIHKDVGLHVYAFSIDDAIGNFYEPGYNSISIDIGGIDHLPDTNPYQTGTTQAQYHLVMGDGRGEVYASVCGKEHIFNNAGNYDFTVHKACRVTLDHPQKTSFTVLQDNHGAGKVRPIHLLGDCHSSEPGFCEKIKVDNSHNAIELPSLG